MNEHDCVMSSRILHSPPRDTWGIPCLLLLALSNQVTEDFGAADANASNSNLAASLTGIHPIAAESFANLPRLRVLGNPAPLARAVDEDGTSRRHAER